MKKIKQAPAHFLKFVASHKRVFIAVLFIFGICLGITIGWFIFKPSKIKTVTYTSVQESNIIQAKKNRVKKVYIANSKLITDDTMSGKLTKDQANKLTVKLKEYYEYRVAALSAEDRDDMLRQKRAEMREWASNNNVSTRYFVGIL